ncbi:DUF3833 domain-containing protein [Shewanella indica]|uniref:DUF3833 domain-containing protein n=1 Tax=Shewanella indica TaxID=768528 RepID=UPI00399BD04F
MLISRFISFTKVWMLLLMLGLSGCGSVDIHDYSASEPKLDLQQFFNGELQASGMVQDYSGQVVRRFNVRMTGSWQGNQGVLQEWFEYDDGELAERTWQITKLADGRYQGRAADILGVAEGQAEGFALRWRYDMLLKLDSNEYQVHFDDWMYQTAPDTIINRSEIRKWGLTVGEVTLVIRKLNEFDANKEALLLHKNN